MYNPNDTDYLFLGTYDAIGLLESLDRRLCTPSKLIHIHSDDKDYLRAHTALNGAIYHLRRSQWRERHFNKR